MHRLFLPDSDLSAPSVIITGEQARYLSTVVRCRPGDVIEIKDNRGATASGRVVHACAREVVCELSELRRLQRESALRLILVQGLLKGEKMDFVVQKSVELGVHAVMPVITERSQPRSTRRTDRWRRIAEEAARQCGRDIVPDVSDPITFREYFSDEQLKGMLFWEEGGTPLMEATAALTAHGSSPLSLLIGPEGGFSAAETETAADAGLLICSLGRRILRAETAAIAALSILQYALGDIGN